MTDNPQTYPQYPAYKNTGIDWLGEIPAHWEVKKLKHVLLFSTGGTPSSQMAGLYNGEEPWVTIGDLDGRYVKNTHFISKRGVREARIPVSPKGSLLYSFKLSVGQVSFTSNDIYTNEAIATFYPQGNVCLNYWYYSLPNFVIKNANTNIYGAFLLNQDLIKNAYILAPPLAEQTRIAEFLDRKTAQIDRAIAQKERLIELLNEQRQVLIHKAVTRGLNPNAPMKPSGIDWIGEIPAHWEATRVKNIFRLIVEPAPNNNDSELLSVYTDIGVKPRKELEERGNKASTTDGYWIVKKGDIIVNKLLAWMGAIGLSNYDGVTSPAYDILRAKRPISGEYYHTLFRSPICSSELKRHSRGIMDMRLRLYFDKFGDIVVPYPPVSEQLDITERLNEIDSGIDKAKELLHNQIQKLQELKSTLINAAVTGKIRV